MDTDTVSPRIKQLASALAREMSNALLPDQPEHNVSWRLRLAGAIGDLSGAICSGLLLAASVALCSAALAASVGCLIWALNFAAQQLAR